MTNESYCANQCQPVPPFDSYECPGRDCEAEDCLIEQCKRETEAAISNDHYPVCGKNDILYPSVLAYCTDKISGPTLPLDFIECSTADCEFQCCNDNCVTRETGLFSGVCNNTDYEWMNNVNAYCAAFCPGRNFDAYICNGSQLCNEEECCQYRCQNLDLVECRVSDWTLVPSPTNCVDKCSSSGITTHGCGSNDCLQQDCDYFKCLNDTILAYGETSFTPICSGHNDKWYDNLRFFCQDHLHNNQQFVTCQLHDAENVCENDTDCCMVNCLGRAFAPGCPESTFEWTDDHREWCEWFCPERANEFYKPGGSLAPNGTELECCHAKCMADPTFLPGCSLDLT